MGVDLRDARLSRSFALPSIQGPSLFAGFTQARQKLTHFTGGVELVLLAGDFDAVTERGAGICDAVELDQKLSAAEK